MDLFSSIGNDNVSFPKIRWERAGNAIVFFAVLLSLSLKISLSFGQSNTIRFEHFTSNDGLLTNSVNDILEDKDGFMWFATEGGLNRFDGYEFKSYIHDPDDSNSIAYSRTNHLAQSSDGNIWVGLYGNLFDLYDVKNDRFSHYRIQVRSTRFLEDQKGNLWIHSYEWLWKLMNGQGICDSVPEAGYIGGMDLYEDRAGAIWIGTWNGIIKYDPTQNTFTSYNLESTVTSIYEDSEGDFWIGTLQKGLILFDRVHGKVTNSFQNNPDNPQSLSHNNVTIIHGKNDNSLWIGTVNGLNILNKKTKEFTRYQHDSNDPNSLSNNEITDICEDRGGNIWISTAGGGVNMIRGHQNPFAYYRHDPLNPYSISNSNVSAFFERPDGNVWIGTKGGLNLFERNYNRFIQFPPLNEDNIIEMALLEDSDGYVWLSSQGLHRFLPTPDYGYSNRTKFPFNPWYIIEDSRRNVWRAGVFSLGRYDLDGSKSNTYPGERGDSTGLIDDHMNSVYEDLEGNVWICANKGLYRYDRENDYFIRYREEEAIIILNDHEGKLLLAERNGASYYDWRNNVYTKYIDLGGITPMGAIVDDNGGYWVMAPNGLYHINPDSNTIKKYDESDGLPINQFNVWSCMKSQSGELFLGGDNGFVVFHPDSLREYEFVPSLAITDFLISNKSVPIKGGIASHEVDTGTTLEQSINYVEEVELPYSKNMFSIEFAALNYANPKNIKYRYILEGFDDDWIITDADNRHATYANLSPGNYVFKITSVNNSSISNNELRSLKIAILHPWWLTWPAYALYFLLAAGVLFGSFRFYFVRKYLKNKVRLEHIQLEKMKKLDTMKSQFFTNLSHEFRTPLTLIFGPLKQLLATEKDAENQNKLLMIIRNSRKLLFLVNQFLDFAKMKTGRLTLQAEETDLVNFVKKRFTSFQSLATTKSINYVFQSESDQLLAYIDRDKLEKILVNLLSNALKFTEDGKDVLVSVDKSVTNKEIDEGSGVVSILVKDSGIGIAPANLNSIFDRFYQVQESNSRIQIGSGIGLTLVKDMVKLHHGAVTVKSKKGVGTTFEVFLPLGKDHLAQNELLLKKEFTPELMYDQEYSRPAVDYMARLELLKDDDSNRLLVIDDNSDMRKYVGEVLEDDFFIDEAKNGKEGLEKAIENLPDLVISDIMMPEMDGNIFCQKLKADERTSHIPVVMLTAKAGEEDRLKGFEIGADDYLVKPFSPSELRVRAHNLIDQRKKLRDRFRKDITLLPKDVSITSADERFLQRALSILEEFSSKEEFQTDQFAKEIGLSRSQLHRKLKALTDQSASEFIRTYRLNQAKQLLLKKFGNISEIAYEVGFKNLSYFAECFKEQFGALPSEYIKEATRT